MTPDDEGGLSGVVDRRPRARQNVVFELGFFIGKLGAPRVAALLKGNVEKPSDFDGIAYIGFDDANRWKTELARELLHAGVPFDPAKALTGVNQLAPLAAHAPALVAASGSRASYRFLEF